MKKVLFVSLIIISSFDIFSQLRIGLRFGGAVSNPRINEISDTLNISKKETSLKPLLGLTFDFPITDNVIFSSGLGYAPKKVTIDYSGNSGNFEGTEEYKLEYLQIPLLIRFITNEIAPGMKLYFTTGFTGDVKVFEESKLRGPELVDKFQPIDASFNLGGGLEFSLGSNTDFYGGLVYYRGLINSVNDAVRSDASLRINNELMGIEVGVRF